jgi:purine nucleoside phosphorylase
LTPGALVLPDQIIDYTWGREHTFCDAMAVKVQHVDFTEPYSESVRRQLIEAAAASGIALHERAVYGTTQGPRLESAAEIRRLQRDGCDIVGMTGMPEAGLARERGLAYACLALIVNPAAGLGGRGVSLADIEQVMAAGLPRVQQLLTAACRLPLATTDI